MNENITHIKISKEEKETIVICSRIKKSHAHIQIVETQ